VVLGDRPIEITLERAWEALSWRRRLDLCAALLGPGPGGPGAAPLTAEFVESLKSDDVLSSFARQLGEQYPELLGPLVHERDLYLAWSLKRSKAVNGTRRVVGVVGRGHLRGIVHALHHDSGSLRFTDLVGGKNTHEYKQRQKVQAAGRLVLELLLGLGLYGAWAHGSAGQ
jgi:pheromone shutdown protein TraB